MIDFVARPPKRLADTDLPRIGYTIGVGEDEVHAFLDVEAAGSGFDRAGRPKMLFEPHVFYRQVSPMRRERAVAAGVAYMPWKRDYPRDSYPRLMSAMLIEETAALKSASWGIAQVMGFNHLAAGYQTVQAMVEAMVEEGEAAQLEAAVRFIKHNHLDDDLRELAKLKRPTTPDDCRPFCRGYNGPSYGANDYHIKLAAAHNKWRRIKDTPWSPMVTGGADMVTGAGRVAAPEPSHPAVVNRADPPPARLVEKPPGFWARLRDLANRRA